LLILGWLDLFWCRRKHLHIRLKLYGIELLKYYLDNLITQVLLIFGL